MNILGTAERIVEFSAGSIVAVGGVGALASESSRDSMHEVANRRGELRSTAAVMIIGFAMVVDGVRPYIPFIHIK